MTTLFEHLPDEPTADALLEGFLSYAEQLGLELYPAQEEAILELFSGSNVILATPTGSGKSLVALALHFMSFAQGKRSFYTAPIKALVNEKFFSLCKSLGADRVGLMTGDATVNADAPVVCATAEIVASMALRQGADAKVDDVVMDEFHYYSDRDRGAAWQVPLLAMPQVRFLLMSATLGDTSKFETGLTELNGAPTALVKTRDRPVPLDYDYRLTPLHETIAELLESGRTPIYIVHFTQRAAAEQAQSLMSIDFLTKDEKKVIKQTMRGHRLDSPFGKELKRWLPHGVGVHHAGMLPKYRLLVEKLAQKGLLKIICGTDTLGVGVNVPIRTVLFTQLCKYDGNKTAVLTVRDFQQIAGRAGRKGFDTAGSVVAQAPAHHIENVSARRKVEGDAKKTRKLKMKKPPERGYAHFDEETFQRLIESDPEPLVSRFTVSHGMILSLLSRQDPDDAPNKAGCHAIEALIRDSHEAKAMKYRHGKRAIAMLRSLVDAGLVELGSRGARIHGELQTDFSMNQALSLWVIEVLEVLDKEDPEYALDVLTLVEASLEDPNAVLYQQLNTLKGRAVNEMKAEGIEYEERMQKLELIDRPKPKADLLYATFDAFAEQHPWAAGEHVRPKSVARELYEMGATFVEYVKEHGLQRSEGVLLRYLSNAYKALVQNVPENAKNDEVYDVTEWLGGLVRRVDASLLDEWERMANPDLVELSALPEPEEAPDITRNERAFTVLVRNAVWRVVQGIARRDARRVATLVPDVDPEQMREQIAAYFDVHERVLVDPTSRSPKWMKVEQSESAWQIHQVISDPEEHQDWQLSVEVDLDESREKGDVVLRGAVFQQL